MVEEFLNFIAKTCETSPIKDCPWTKNENIDIISGDTINREITSDIKEATILVVDDNRDLTDYMGEAMEDYVKKVYTANNAYAAIDVLTMRHVDVIISDIMMPGMDGFDLCKYIKSNVITSHIPVILLTARVEAESRNLGYKSGADDYITKPFLEEDIVSSIENVLKLRAESKNKIAETMEIDETSTFSAVDENLLKTFHCLVRDNMASPDFGVQKLGEMMQMNHTVLFNKIVELTGMNIISYINRMRLEKAIHLMKTTEMNMAEIAQQTGFNNQRYFSTSFKNYTGVSPLKYKNSLTNG